MMSVINGDGDPLFLGLQTVMDWFVSVSSSSYILVVVIARIVDVLDT